MKDTICYCKCCLKANLTFGFGSEIPGTLKTPLEKGKIDQNLRSPRVASFTHSHLSSFWSPMSFRRLRWEKDERLLSEAGRAWRKAFAVWCPW